MQPVGRRPNNLMQMLMQSLLVGGAQPVPYRKPTKRKGKSGSKRKPKVLIAREQRAKMKKHNKRQHKSGKRRQQS